MEWNSFRTDGRVEIHSEITTVPGGQGDEVHAYVVRPGAEEGPVPGIVVVHHMPGWDEFNQEFAERLGRHGYNVVAPDFYCRYGHGTPDDIAAKVRSEGGVPDASVIADAKAARDWLVAQPNSNGKVGIIGTCSGGRHSVLVASSVDGFDAVADLWGGGVVMAPDQLTPARPVAPIDLTEQLQAPLLGIFGNDDRSPTPDQVDQHEALLKELGKTYAFHRYDGAGHGFFYYHVTAYRPEQAMDAWEKIFEFFATNLKASA